jgi:hypothetical protein
MRIDGLDHPKTIDLADELGILVPQAIGHLELLWAFTGRKTPQGNIGRWSDAVIAHAAQWPGKSSDFVVALVRVGFLDKDDEHRLIVHDWHEHMPRWVKAKLKREGKTVVGTVEDTGDETTVGTTVGTTDPTSAREGKGRQGKASEGKGRKRALPRDFQISKRVKDWAKRKGHRHLSEHLESFKAKCQAHDYRYVDWDAAFMEAIRKDWAGIEGKDSSKETDTWLRGCQ